MDQQRTGYRHIKEEEEEERRGGTKTIKKNKRQRIKGQKVNTQKRRIDF